MIVPLYWMTDQVKLSFLQELSVYVVTDGINLVFSISVR